jgi:DNA-binding response OmpR family regulator
MMRQLRFIGLFFAPAVLLAMDAVAQEAPPVAAAPAEAALATAPVQIAKRDPAVDTIIASNPTTPGQLLRAALLLADLDHVDLAKKYLAQLAASKPDEKALADAVVEVDSDMLVRIAGHKDLQPEGAQFAHAVLASAAKRAGDSRELMAEIDKLDDQSAPVRKQAIAKLLAAHEDAVPAIVATLADQSRVAVQSAARGILVSIGGDAIAPLVAALKTDDAALKVQIIDVLRKIGSRDAVVYLIAPATAAGSPPEVRDAARRALTELQGSMNPTAEEAAKLLIAEIQQYLKHQRPLAVDPDEKVRVWRASATNPIPVKYSLAPAHAEAVIADRLARDLTLVAPDDPQARRLALVCLEVIAYDAGFDNRENRAQLENSFKFGAEDAKQVEDALSYAMSIKHWPAATILAEILGDVGDRTFLESHDALVRPLVTAVGQGDRRTRFAAAEAIMKLKPASGFAGSSDLMAALAFFADSPGEKRALVGHPNAVIGAQLAAMLAAMGYEADSVTNSRQAYLHATAGGDYELVLLSGPLDRPPVWVLTQELRRDPRTAGLPIALLTEDLIEDADRLESIADGDPRAVVFKRPLVLAEMKFHVERFVAAASDEIIPSAVREQQALAALDWLKKLNELSPKDFDVRPYEAVLIRALHRAITTDAAADLLARIGTHAAQRSLTEIANTPSLPTSARQTAAAAFSRAVRRHGIQLTSAEIAHQYDRYNQSMLEDQPTQQLLGLMLDALEAPTKK